ncbi:MAG: hypothetical protein GY730_09020 [bacterium]|nr:hypothetical protein [bacterium]
MKQIDKHRFSNMAETYDKLCQYLVPGYDLIQNEVFNIVAFDKEDKLTFVDLGAGSGIFIEKILNRYPNACAYWVDFSEDFLAVAKKRLASFGNNI